MRFGTIAALVVALQANPVFAQQEPVETAFSSVLRGCETWVMNPASWVNGPEPFLAAMDLGPRVTAVATIPEAFRPPPGELRRGNRFWRINATDRAGFALTVSDQRPMCHIVGVGFADFRKATAALLASAAFTASWEPFDAGAKDTGRSLVFRHRTDRKFVLTLSQRTEAQDGAGIIHVIATAAYAPDAD